MTSPRFLNAEGQVLPPVRFDPFDVVVGVTTFAWHVSKSAVLLFDFLDDRARSHANWRRERRELADSVQDTIDRL